MTTDATPHLLTASRAITAVLAFLPQMSDSDRRVRIRFVRAAEGEVDGIPLDRFQVGRIYDVGASLATYLILMKSALPVANETPALVVPLDQVPLEQFAVAHDSGVADEEDDELRVPLRRVR